MVYITTIVIVSFAAAQVLWSVKHKLFKEMAVHISIYVFVLIYCLSYFLDWNLLDPVKITVAILNPIVQYVFGKHSG